ncbi:MAG TPA: amylo-alpha-1,6-glucosidase [Micromonosporaceae bacterium]|nr:amylo-alpha-1,6-glucosidase [Micromonosporaceae bacterium]
MIPIRFGSQVGGDLAAGSAREWLVADGAGGYAMGTVAGLCTRRYHGLLVVALDSPSQRRLGLASLDPVVTLASGAKVRLATHEWASGVIAPSGHELLESFDLDDGLPRWRWRIGNVVIERELAMAAGGSCLGVVHRLLAGSPVGLALDAVVTWRDVHGERTAGSQLAVVPADGGVAVESAYRLVGPGWQGRGAWWTGVHYREEAARGLNPTEDLWYAGRFVAPLRRAGDIVEVTAWAGDLASRPPDAVEIISAARERNRAIAMTVADAAARSSAPLDTATVGSLAVAADAFVVRHPDGRGSGRSASAAHPDVVAGYPWFGTWTRDTMLSYPGLFLATGRADEGRTLLRAYAATLSEGMLANTADTGELRFNSVDGTLWFAYAVDRHVSTTGDVDLAAEMAPKLRSMVGAHLAGTRFGIKVTDDGLLTQGSEGEALTWMDARIDGVAVTPRAGKPVEVNALWINALASAAVLSRRTGQPTVIPDDDRDIDLDALLRSARSAFAARFPRRDGTLADVVDGPDPRGLRQMRPNQLLAWSLPYAPLAPGPRALEAIGAALLTPIGLRSLDSADPEFRGRHRGGPADRDRAYHQGTVWPWLIGPYVDACRRAGLSSTPYESHFVGLRRHLAEYGLGSVSETADGSAPHAGTGCPFQAWSVAEFLRVGLTDPYGVAGAP